MKVCPTGAAGPPVHSTAFALLLRHAPNTLPSDLESQCRVCWHFASGLIP
jgi:hypothetical protein